MRTLYLLIAALLPCNNARATVTAITNKAQWLSTVGMHERIGFTEYPQFTIITTQYAERGVVFTDGNDWIRVNPAFTSDGHGLISDDGVITAAFVQPMYAYAIEFNGTARIQLYDHGTLIYTSVPYTGEFTPFIGFVSTTPFDGAVALDQTGSFMRMDNIYFGPPVPAPAALSLLGLASVAGCLPRRRRRSR